MRITQDTVRRVSDHTGTVTEEMFGRAGRFKLQAIGGDLGSGTRFIDGRHDRVWLGSRGGRQAAAYYYGVVEAANAHTGGTIGDLPEWLREVAAEVRGRCQEWIDKGHADLMSAVRWHEIRAEVRAEVAGR